jgi:membrane dipeptidase
MAAPRGRRTHVRLPQARPDLHLPASGFDHEWRPTVNDHDTSHHDIDRRRFVVSAAGLVAAGRGALNRDQLDAMPAASAPSATTTGSWPGYDKATVIDFLASPGYFNYPLNPPLDATMIGHAVHSGLTAVNLTVSSSGFADTVENIARWMTRIEEHPEAFRQARTVADIADAKATRRLGIVLGFQDTVPFEGRIENVELFRNLGVRVAQLTYNVRNLVGDGCLEPANGGLSRFGHAVVERMNTVGMLVDLSHCGQNTTAEGISASKRPVAITHSGCNAVARHPRSKDDTELRALAQKGGVIGIYLMPFLSPGRVPTRADVLDHLEHALNVCGEDHVGIGSDLSTTPIDGSGEYLTRHREFVAGRIARGIAAPNEDPDILFTVPELNNDRRLELVAEGLASRGHGSARIAKVIGGNWLRLFGEVWTT